MSAQGRSLRVRGRSGFRRPQSPPSWASIVSGNSPCPRRARSPSPPPYRQKPPSRFRRSPAPSPASVLDWHTVSHKRPPRHHRGTHRRSLAPLRRRPLPQDYRCYRCGEAGHFARDCRNARVCSICRRIGHSARLHFIPPMRPVRVPSQLHHPSLLTKPITAASPSFGTAGSPLQRSDLHPKTLSPSASVPRLPPAPSSVSVNFSPTMVSNFNRLRNKVIISVSDKHISSLQLEISLRRLWGREWAWIAMPLGSNEFLISFPSRELMLEQVKVQRFHIDGFSLSVRRWSADHRAFQRAATVDCWLQLDGLPLFCWEPADVAAIVSGIGQFRRLHSRTAAKQDLISVVALVGVHDGGIVPNELDLHIGAFSFKVRVSNLPSPVIKPSHPSRSRLNPSAPTSSRAWREKGKEICSDPLVPGFDQPSGNGLLAQPSTAVPSHGRTTPNPSTLPPLGRTTPNPSTLILHQLGNEQPAGFREGLPSPIPSLLPSTYAAPDTLMPKPLTLVPAHCFDPMVSEASICPSFNYLGPASSGPLINHPISLTVPTGLLSVSAQCNLNQPLFLDAVLSPCPILSPSPVSIASSLNSDSLALVPASFAPPSVGNPSTLPTSPLTSPSTSFAASPSLDIQHPILMMAIHPQKPDPLSCQLTYKRGRRPRSLTAPPTSTRRSARLLQVDIAESTNAKCARRAAIRALETPSLTPSLSDASSAADLGSTMKEPASTQQDSAGPINTLPDSLFHRISTATGLLLGDDPSAAISQVKGLEQLPSL